MVEEEIGEGGSRRTYIQISTRQNRLNGGIKISISANNGAILPTQLHQTGFEVLSTGARNLATNGRAAGEVDLAHSRVLDHGVDNLGGVLRAARDQVQAAGGQTGVLEGANKGPVRAGGVFGGFQDGRVTGCEGACGAADAKDVWRIPVVDLVNLHSCNIERYRWRGWVIREMKR